MTPHPSSPAVAAGAAGSTFVHCPAATSVFSMKATDAEGGGELGAVFQSHLLRRVVCVEAVLRLTAAAGPAVAADGSPVEDHVVARLDVSHALADGFHQARRLVAEEEREVVVDAALAVVEVGVADAARLDGDECLSRTRIGHDNGLDLDWCALGAGDDSTYVLRHLRSVRDGHRAF